MRTEELLEKAADILEVRGYNKWGIANPNYPIPPVCQIAAMQLALASRKQYVTPSDNRIAKACIELHGNVVPMEVFAPKFQYKIYHDDQQKVIRHMRETAARLRNEYVPKTFTQKVKEFIGV